MTVFKQPCLFPWRVFFLAESNGSGLGGSCRSPWWPLTCSTGSPALPSCVSLKVFTTLTRRYHGRTLIRPSLPAAPLQEWVFARSQVRDPHVPPPPVAEMLWRLQPLGHLQVSSGIVRDFLIIRIIVRNRANASVLSRCVQFGFSLPPMDSWLYAVILVTSLTILLANCSWYCCDLFLRQSALNPHISVWWIFVEQRESCHTDPGFRQ